MSKDNEIFIVTGGKRNNETFSLDRLAYSYDAGIYRVDFGEKRIIESYIECDLNENIYVPEYTLSFRAGCINRNEIITCTHSEIVIFDSSNLVVKNRISDTCFNDIHCVLPDGKKIWFTSTGIDMVGCIDGKGSIELFPVINDANERLQENVDYRCVCTKPHRSHPNFVFFIDGNIWVTRFNQKDAICLDDHSRRINIGVERPHDGIVRDNRVYFTTVDGKLVECDVEKGEPIRVHDLSGHYRSGNPGWCRGLSIEGDYAYIGFTAIRKTRNIENLSFLTDAVRMIGDRLKNNAPARILKYNLKKEKIEDEMLFRPSEIGIVFSILGQ